MLRTDAGEVADEVIRLVMRDINDWFGRDCAYTRLFPPQPIADECLVDVGEPLRVTDDGGDDGREPEDELR